MRRPSFVFGIAALGIATLGITVISSVAGIAQTPATRTFIPERFYNTFSGAHPPALSIKTGERIVTKTIDASGTDWNAKQVAQGPNPQTGPFFVEGAEPGDSLAVAIGAIRPTLGQCCTRTADPKQLGEWLGTDCPHGTRVCPIVDDRIHWSDELTIPYAPMLGCIGTAPDWGVPSTAPAGTP